MILVAKSTWHFYRTVFQVKSILFDLLLADIPCALLMICVFRTLYSPNYTYEEQAKNWTNSTVQNCGALGFVRNESGHQLNKAFLRVHTAIPLMSVVVN